MPPFPADKIYPGASFVRNQRRACLERTGERDTSVGGADSYRPTEATGEREGDVSVVRMKLYVKRWPLFASTVREERPMLDAVYLQTKHDRGREYAPLLRR